MDCRRIIGAGIDTGTMTTPPHQHPQLCNRTFSVRFVDFRRFVGSFVGSALFITCELENKTSNSEKFCS